MMIGFLYSNLCCNATLSTPVCSLPAAHCKLWREPIHCVFICLCVPIEALAPYSGHWNGREVGGDSVAHLYYTSSQTLVWCELHTCDVTLWGSGSPCATHLTRAMNFEACRFTSLPSDSPSTLCVFKILPHTRCLGSVSHDVGL